MNIFFHGASVTAQNKDGSYVSLLLDLLNDDPKYIINKMGYGGTHFGTAGVLTFCDDIKNNPDICFLDWNVTGLDFFNENDISYIVGAAVEAGVLPVFLIFARRDNLCGDRACDDQVKRFCELHHVPLIDMRPFVNPDVHLRDVVHTSHDGGLLYANKIFDFIVNCDVRYLFSLIPKRNYVKYSICCQRDLGLVISEGMSLSIDVSHCLLNSRIVVETVHGPESPIIKVSPGGNKIQIWDQWSHFDRPGFVQLFKSDSEISELGITVDVLKDSIDYNICNRPFEFSGVKKMYVNGVYGVDCNINSVFISA